MNVVINYTIDQIAKYTNGRLVNYNPGISSPAYLSLDSRKILFPESTIFIALNTVHRNGNEFVETLYQKGVRNFLIEDRNLDLNKISEANVIIVSDTTQALQLLATNHRINHNLMPGGNKLPIIGITGSNGKTIVKEWLDQLLENDFTIVRSPGSYNSQLGVPLSVLNLNASHTLGIFEAGISTFGEMDLLEKIIKPNIGVFTNIGQAHDEGFKNAVQKINEKLKLFIHTDNLIFSGDDKLIKKEVIGFKQRIKKYKNDLNLFSWGKAPGNDLQICSINKNKNSTNFHPYAIPSFSIKYNLNQLPIIECDSPA